MTIQETQPVPSHSSSDAEEPVVTHCDLGTMPKIFTDPMPRVTVTLSDGSEEFLFDYYPDEIQFSENDFIGKTLKIAKRVKFQKDRQFLRS